MGAPLRVALIAHDGPKSDMLEWARWNRDLLSRAKLYATKHTGELVAADTGLRIEHSRRSHTRPTCARSYGSRCSTTSRSRATAARRT
jgi:hypothetical protein